MKINTGLPKQFTLGKNERLKSRKQIAHLFSGGQRFVVPLFRVFYSFQAERRVDEPGAFLQAGFGASSRNFKTAVDRNRIKRLTREAYRLQKKKLQEMVTERGQPLSVFFIYTGKTLPGYDEVSKSIAKALDKLLEIMKKKS
jgi:ribonuclease P protein component